MAKKEVLNPETINIEVDLTPDEKIEKGLALVEKMIDIHNLKAESKEVAKGYKERIGGLDDEKRKIADTIFKGTEYRLFESVKERDDENQQYIFLEVVDGKRTDNILKSVPYESKDFQYPIPDPEETETENQP